MKKLILILTFTLFFLNSSFSQSNDELKIDSVFVFLSGKVLLNENLNKNYKGNFILYNSNDTIIALKNKTKIDFSVNGIRVNGKYGGEKRQENYYAFFEGEDGGRIIVKITDLSFENSSFRVIHIIYVLGTLILLFLIFKFLFQKIAKTTKYQNTQSRSDGDTIFNRLMYLGYFRFVDRNSFQLLKDDLIDSINNHNVLSTIEDEETLIPMDYRLYFCDGEDLYEEGGLISNLERVSSAFTKRGLKLLWSNEKYEIINDANYQSISLNNKIYCNIFKDKDLDSAWGVAAKYFYLMLDDQLEIQGSEERIYPISGGNDGQFLILTKEQFGYIISIGLQKEWEPMELQNWINENKL